MLGGRIESAPGPLFLSRHTMSSRPQPAPEAKRICQVIQVKKEALEAYKEVCVLHGRYLCTMS